MTQKRRDFHFGNYVNKRARNFSSMFATIGFIDQHNSWACGIAGSFR